MVRRVLTGVAVALAVSAGSLSAQATGTPSFNAPYRAFESHEFGATGSLVGFDNLGVEGQYRFGHKKFDIGVRAGYVDGGAGGTFVAGAEGRGQVLTASSSFPLDGALVAGLGTAEFDNLWVPVGLSLGRRVNLDGFSFVAYGQPTIGFQFDGNDANDTVQFGLGFGADFKLGESVDLRTSLGLFDIEGLAASIVWVH
jgi:hypothetical protein